MVAVSVEPSIAGEQSRSESDELHEWARRHLQRVRQSKVDVALFVLGMIVLTPIWALVEWQSAGGFERFSDGEHPGDWEPWLLYIAIPWGLYVAYVALRTHFDRPTTRGDIEREVRRLMTQGWEVE